MPTKKFLTSLLVFSTLTATGVLAQNFQEYGSEAGWSIVIKEDLGPGCLMMKSNEDGTQIQMGIDATEEPRGYMAFYTKEEATVTAGEEFAVVFDVDGEEFQGEAVGQELEGYKGAWTMVNNPAFIYDLAEKNTLTITPEGHREVTVNLEGTHAAFEALRTCQEAQPRS